MDNLCTKGRRAVDPQENDVLRLQFSEGLKVKVKLLPQIQDQWVRMLAILLGVFAVVTTGLSVTGSAQTLRGEASLTVATFSKNQFLYFIMVAMVGVG